MANKTLENLPPLRDVIARHNLRAEKSLGQNFLLDQNITDKIVKQAGDVSGKTILEIGSGPGGLTRSLLNSNAKKIIAIEFDPRAVNALQELAEISNNRLEIIHADALTANLIELCSCPRIIIANLPYNIATVLLTNWLKQIRNDQTAYESMILMFQKEVAERITAAIGNKTYGRLSIISQWLCQTKKCFDLPPSAFTPPPKVKSSVVKFTPHPLDKNAPKFEAIESITKAAFGQRRKMIRSSLKDYAQYFNELNLDETLRAENLSVNDFILLASK